VAYEDAFVGGKLIMVKERNVERYKVHPSLTKVAILSVCCGKGATTTVFQPEEGQ